MKPAVDCTQPEWRPQATQFAGRSLALIAMALACAGAPGLVFADDTLGGLDATMEVLGDESELGALVSELRRPDDPGFRGGTLADDLDELVQRDEGAEAAKQRVFPDEPDGFDEDIADEFGELEAEDAFETHEGDDLD